jgi:hypothetical protein
VKLAYSIFLTLGCDLGFFPGRNCEFAPLVTAPLHSVRVVPALSGPMQTQ